MWRKSFPTYGQRMLAAAMKELPDTSVQKTHADASMTANNAELEEGANTSTHREQAVKRRKTIELPDTSVQKTHADASMTANNAELEEGANTSTHREQAVKRRKTIELPDTSVQKTHADASMTANNAELEEGANTSTHREQAVKRRKTIEEEEVHDDSDTSFQTEKDEDEQHDDSDTSFQTEEEVEDEQHDDSDTSFQTEEEVEDEQRDDSDTSFQTEEEVEEYLDDDWNDPDFQVENVDMSDTDHVSDSDNDSAIVSVLDLSSHLSPHPPNPVNITPANDSSAITGPGASIQLFAKREKQDGCKQVYDKTNFCVFCQKEIKSKLARHLLTVHKKEPSIGCLLTLPKRSEERMIRLEILANEGNFRHNISVMKESNGCLVVGRREINKINHPNDYLPCIHCKKYIMRENLWLHQKNCKVRVFYSKNTPEEPTETEESTSTRNNAVRQSRTLLGSALMEQPGDDCLTQLLSRMQHDNITEVVRNDTLIRRYAALRVESLGPVEDQKINDIHKVSQCCRTLARLVLGCRERDKSAIITLDKLISPEKFDTVVEVTKSLCGLEQNTALTLGKLMGNILMHAIQIKTGMASRAFDNTKTQQADSFQRLYDAEWNFRVNAVCQKKRDKISRKKVKTIPLTEDLKTLRSHVVSSMECVSKSLNENPTPQDWTSLAKLTMCRLIMFNKRRRAEVKDLKVGEYLQRPDWQKEQRGEFDLVLSPSDRMLASRMDMVISAGKSRKNVDAYVIIPPDAKQAIDLLNTTRHTVGVPRTNEYIFARLNADTPLSGNTDLKECVLECKGLQCPERITSTGLRRYVGTVAQILDMTDSELDSLARHLGHDPKTHKENYRLSHSTRELTVVSQLLIAVENGCVNKWKNKPLSAISVDELPDVQDRSDKTSSSSEIDVPGINDDAELTDKPKHVQKTPWKASMTADNAEKGAHTHTQRAQAVKPKKKIDDGTGQQLHNEGRASQGACGSSKGKSKRWSGAAEDYLRKKFKFYLYGVRSSVHKSDMLDAQQACSELLDYSLPQIRSKLNNMKLGKSKLM